MILHNFCEMRWWWWALHAFFCVGFWTSLQVTGSTEYERRSTVRICCFGFHTDSGLCCWKSTFLFGEARKRYLVVIKNIPNPSPIHKPVILLNNRI